jgi:uncharacterized protein YecT (DUF1311 family)
MRLSLLPAIALLAAAWNSTAAWADDAADPSFDCTQAKEPAEQIICADSALRARDLWLALTYRDILALSPEDKTKIQADQRRWLQQRDALCDLPDASRTPGNSDRKAFNCLVSLYDDRIATLGGASFEPVFREAAKDPAAALVKLHPLQSPLARVYAELLYHVLADGTADAFDNFRIDLVERIHRSTLWIDGPVHHIDIPCSLVDRLPRLLQVGRATYGSTMDLELPGFDCADEAPAPPASVSALIKADPSTYQAKLDACADRSGTYFTSVEHQLRQLMLRLVRFPRSYLSAAMGPSHAPDETWPTVETIDAADWKDDAAYATAKRDLAAFYGNRYRLSPSDAAAAAARALWDSRYGNAGLDGCD